VNVTGTIRIETKPCPRCLATTWLTVRAESVQLWKRGALLQEAFPELTVNQRELILTGYHDACWDADLGFDTDDVTGEAVQ